MGVAAIGRAKRHLKPLRHFFEPASGVYMMANPRPDLNVTSAYDAFLFAPIVDESGVMRLSVLSALARMNVDPGGGAPVWRHCPRRTQKGPSSRHSIFSPAIHRARRKQRLLLPDW